MLKKGFLLLTFLALFSTALPLGATADDRPFTFGLLLVGPYNDHGWSQAHYEGGKYVEKMVPGAKLIYIDKVNPADRPGVTIPQLVDDMVEKGAVPRPRRTLVSVAAKIFRRSILPTMI